MPIWGDSFNDADGTGLLAHTPDSPTPFAWLLPGGVSVDSGEPIIVDNALVPDFPTYFQADFIAPVVDEVTVPGVIRVEMETQWHGTFLDGDDSVIALYLLTGNDFTEGYLAVINFYNGVAVGDWALYKGDFTDPFGYVFLDSGTVGRPGDFFPITYFLEINPVTGHIELADTNTGDFIVWDDLTYAANLVASGFTIGKFGPTAMFEVLSVGRPTGIINPFTEYDGPSPVGAIPFPDPAVAVLDCNNDPA